MSLTPNTQNSQEQIIQAVCDPMSSTIKTSLNVVNSPSVFIFNQKTVTTSGTRVQLTATPTTISSVVIKGLAANTGKIYVGDVTVTTSNGFELAAGATISIAVNDLSKVYIDASANSQSISFLAS